jgi:hypothetical protein
MTRWMDDETDGWNDASRRPLLYVISCKPTGKRDSQVGIFKYFLILYCPILHVYPSSWENN